MGAGSIPAKHSGLKSQTAVSQLEMSGGIKHSKEVVFMDGKIKRLTDITTLQISIKLLVVALVGCLMVAPLTRDQENKD